jgi:predicted dehydrogenase
MKVVVIGLGVQGNKRLAIAGSEVVATMDPVNPKAHYTAVEQVPLENYDAALVCTPDQVKLGILEFLLAHGKHVLVEKPLLAAGSEQIRKLGELARSTGAACYTAYNHRFEPNIVRLKEMLDVQTLGNIYLAKFFYGNGTALNVKRSPWRDQGIGVLADLGSHLLDLTLFLFGETDGRFEPWSLNRFENRAFDHVLFGSCGKSVFELEGTLVSWRNTFSIDVFGELGSAHIHGLCKWGPSTLTVRRRVFPSGKPDETMQAIECPDPTWAMEYEHFKHLCQISGTNIANDVWINTVLSDIAEIAGEEYPW